MLGLRKSGGVNLFHVPSESYDQIQEQIFGLVAAQLPPHRVTQTVGRPVRGALNWVLHVRMGAPSKQYTPPAQVVMSHGLADKSYLFVRHPETGLPHINSFDHVLVPGEWIKNRLLERARSRDAGKRVLLDESQIHVVGWPRLDPLVGCAPAQGPVSDRRLRLLWAPSHDRVRVGADVRRLSSYPALEQHLPRLREAFDVEVSLHPANRERKSPTTTALARADVVVADFGTLLYESWALQKCVIMPTFLMPSEITGRLPESAEAHVYRERIGQHAGSIDELIDMARANEPPDSRVRGFMDEYLAPQYSGCSSRRIAEVLQAHALEPTWRNTFLVRAPRRFVMPTRRAQYKVRRALSRTVKGQPLRR